MIGIGTHLLLDGFTNYKLSSSDLHNCVKDCISIINLTIVLGPVFHSLERYHEVWVIVAESHINIKAFMDGTVLVDVFSCKSFDTNIVVSSINKILNLKYSTYRIINRAGTE